MIRGLVASMSLTMILVFGVLFRTHPLTYKRIEKLYQQERELNPQSS